MTNPLPTRDQIKHVKHLHSSRLFGPATIARLTDVPLRDVFWITRIPVDAETPDRFPPIVTTPAGKILGGVHRPDWLKIGRDGTVHAGLHRLFAMLQVGAE